MLVDSHCHLDYFTPMELPDVLSRAAAAGVHEMVTIGTTLAQSERLPPMTEAIREPLVHHRRPSAPRRRGADPDARNPGGDGAPSSRHRHRRVRPGLFLRQIAARHSGGEFPRPTSAAPAWPACRFASTPATPTTISR